MIERLTFLFGNEWFSKLEPFLLSQDFAKINKFIVNERRFGKIIYPESGSNENFINYRLTQPSKIKVVIIGSHYTYDDTYDGILWSGSKLIEESLILKTIASEIESSMDSFQSLASGLDLMDLTRWCKQGVFMLSPEITIEKNHPLGHIPVWNSLIKETIKVINEYHSICWVMVGEPNWTFEGLLNPRHRKIKVRDPLNNPKHIEGMFNNINEFLDLVNKKNIIW